MPSTYEIGRVTITSALPVDGYDEESGTPDIVADAKPDLKVAVEVDEIVAQAGGLAPADVEWVSLTLAAKMLKAALDKVNDDLSRVTVPARVEAAQACAVREDDNG